MSAASDYYDKTQALLARLRDDDQLRGLSAVWPFETGWDAKLDGIIAKRRDLPYRSGDRTGMQKIKNYRSADCVVGGFRYNEGKPVVGSLLLGLYDDASNLHHVGFTSTIKREIGRAHV